jgi:hypothetical protein
VVWFHSVAWVALGGLFLAGFRPHQDPLDDTLRVRMLEVVDEHGIVRARLGARLPDAVLDGKRIVRGEEIAGLLLYDARGGERGGYVTFEPSGNVGLTLDHAREQAALFVAGREDGVALKLWTGPDSIELRSDGDGSRWTVAEDGVVALQEPSVMPGADVCAEYRAALASLSREEVLRACRERFSAEACEACLGE